MKNVIISGASSGIGAELVKKFSENGWAVIMIARNKEKLEALSALYPNAKPLVCDLTDKDQLNSIKEELNQVSIHALINNAGVYKPQSLDKDEDSTWEFQWEGNMMSAVRLTRLVWENLKSSKGNVLNISSTLSKRPIHTTAAYSATKAAMNNWTLSLALEGAPFGVRANAICPGIIGTPIHSWYQSERPEDKELFKVLQKAQPLGRTGEVQDISGMALQICRSESEWITGNLINIDGGILLNS